MAKGHSRRVPGEEFNIDFRAVWRLLQCQLFHPQKPRKVTRFHETSLNDQVPRVPDLRNNLFVYLLFLNYCPTNPTTKDPEDNFTV